MRAYLLFKSAPQEDSNHITDQLHPNYPGWCDAHLHPSHIYTPDPYQGDMHQLAKANDQGAFRSARSHIDNHHFNNFLYND